MVEVEEEEEATAAEEEAARSASNAAVSRLTSSSISAHVKGRARAESPVAVAVCSLPEPIPFFPVSEGKDAARCAAHGAAASASCDSIVFPIIFTASARSE
jgi:hypothetical protein